MANLENYKAMGEGFNPYSFRNKIINGEVTRINQRNFDGSSWVNGKYAYDRWKATGSNMTQIIEDGNYKYNTTHTLSGDGVTTQQLTSPASGNWTLPEVPRTARNIQLEEGSIATPFEVRPIGMELSLCQRYFVSLTIRAASYRYNAAASGYLEGMTGVFSTRMRDVPTMTIYSAAYQNCVHRDIIGTVDGFNHRVDSLAAGNFRLTTGNIEYIADAEL